jgi:hypothetical protein
MTEREINIAIAVAIGWKHRDGGMWYMPDGSTVGEELMPKYSTSLDAMQSAVMSQGWGDSEEVDFFMALQSVCEPGCADPFATACATALQRAEAFLKTIGKWQS